MATQFDGSPGAGRAAETPDGAGEPPIDALVVIPAHEEAGIIGQVVQELRALGLDVLVVDDGSADDTAARATAAGAVVVAHPINLGQGAALQTGFRYALDAGYEAVVTFDADGQHDASDALALAEALGSGDVDVVLGSRFLGDAPGMKWSRRGLLRAAILFTRLTTGLRISDTHNGVRAIRSSALRRIRLDQARMAHASELLHHIANLGLTMIEVPVTIRYTDYSMAKGQGSRGAVRIVTDLALGRLARSGRPR